MRKVAMSIEKAINELQYRAKDFSLVDKRDHFQIEGAKQLMLEIMAKVCYLKEPVWLKSYDGVANWLEDNQKKGLFVIGGCGTGKTLLCAKVIPLIFTHIWEIMPSVYSAYSLNRYASEIIFNRNRNLVIDDIGVEGVLSDYGEKRIVFNEIVDQAERLGQTLIITTNLDTKQLNDKYGERTMDRLKAITKQVIFSENSMRAVLKETKKK